MASFGATVLDRMTSDISRLRAISSLVTVSFMLQDKGSLSFSWYSYKLLPVALSICSSRAVLAEDDHQLIILAYDCLADSKGEGGPTQEGWISNED